MLMMSLSAHAYNVVNLPETMTLSDAMGIFNVSEITRMTVSDTADGQYVTLTNSDIQDFFNTAMSMTVERRINPTPFRGIAVNVFTNDGVKSYYLNSGIQIGLYGSGNYICYKLDDKDTEQLLYLDSTYKDSTQKQNDAQIYRDTGNDFLKLPAAQWAQPAVREAAAKSLLPYEFTDKYSENITREQFCILLGNMITVHENYISLDAYMFENGGAYLKNYFEDCDGVDNSVNILHALGIVSGRDETHFDPYGTLTREEAATLLCRVAERYRWVGIQTSLSYSDTWSISPWAVFYVTWANENGIMSGVSDIEFAPKGTYTVEQAIVTVARLYNLINS